MFFLRMFTLIFLLLLALPQEVYAVIREYFICAEVVEWDYAPSNKDLMMNMNFNEEARIFVEQGKSRIGKKYKKILFREYTDESFSMLKERSPEWQHLGLLGPLLRAEVGDEFQITFLNRASRPHSIHPHGVFYEKHSEGALTNDGTTGSDRADDAVEPGKTYVYRWQVPERAGPGPNDPTSIVWLYHSHVDSIKDSNSGLFGAMIITAKGQAKADGSPLNVDREFVTYFGVINENESWLQAENILNYTKNTSLNIESEDFIESNLKHSINGYIYGNLTGLQMHHCDRTRWYLISLGTEVDLHTPHWHGNTGLWSGHRVDTIELLPASMKTVDVRMDNPGTWMFHCHVDDHIRAGMTALYTVLPNITKQCD